MTIFTPEVTVKLTSFIVAWAIVLIPTILFIISIQQTLKAITFKNRKMSVFSTWLFLIPFWGTIWSFLMVKYVSESIQDELKDNGVIMNHKPTYMLGLMLSIVSVFTFFPFESDYASYGWLICFFYTGVK